MLVPNLKSDMFQPVRILSVGENRCIDDLTNVPFPCYNIRVSNAHRRGVCRFNPSVKARGRNGLFRFYYGICLHFRVCGE